MGVEFFLILECGSSILQLGKFKKRKRKLASKFDFIYETWKPCLNLNAKEPYNSHRNRNTQIFALSLRTKRSFSYIGSIYITLLSLDYLWELHGLAIKSGSTFYPKITIFFYVGIYKTLRIFSGIYDLLHFMSDKKYVFFFYDQIALFYGIFINIHTYLLLWYLLIWIGYYYCAWYID